MSKEFHLYTAGQDPFVLPMGDMTLYIHQGVPTSSTPPVSSSSTEEPNIYVPKTQRGLYENYIQAPTEPGVLKNIIDEWAYPGFELGVALSPADDPTSDQFRAAVDGLSRSWRDDVTIH